MKVSQNSLLVHQFLYSITEGHFLFLFFVTIEQSMHATNFVNLIIKRIADGRCRSEWRLAGNSVELGGRLRVREVQLIDRLVKVRFKWVLSATLIAWFDDSGKAVRRTE